jgi:hypothetical protein
VELQSFVPLGSSLHALAIPAGPHRRVFASLEGPGILFYFFRQWRRLIEHGDNPEYRRGSLVERENHVTRNWYASLPVGELNQLKEYVLC